MRTDTPRRPPSVERVLRLARAAVEPATDPATLTAAARAVVDDERRRLIAGSDARTDAALADAVAGRLAAEHRSPDLAAINATGVILHTNLGRAPWPDEAITAAREAAGSVLLELDRVTGRRGARVRLVEEHLVALTGAEDALVTNNNAAAVALAVGLAGRGRGVAVSRGELVEIGGGVRIPEIVRRAGARLVEVGTTNRTRAADYREPLADGTARIVLRVHPSNFAQSGFTETPDARAVADLAHEHGAIVVDDLGSGALLPTERFGLAHEPTPAERLADGADLVTFSGDKLVGGPQAGFIVGRADFIARLRRDPLARAMRPDKVTLAAVAATLGLYRAGVAAERIPVWRMIGAPVEELRTRARDAVAVIGDGATVVDVRSTIGGGSLPGETLPGVAIAVARATTPGRSLERFLARLRTGTPAVVGRIEADVALFDLRTVDREADATLVDAIRRALRPTAVGGRGRSEGSDSTP
ncbi:MAG TPA: L-seryl-tRNA(Sec) selenium transferase [Candidatus Limnocylindrales bacterium]|nr:L-seryl-tRNA(Sec) selenium transferase [Candidatus Limnocylindrales bacterium]